MGAFADRVTKKGKQKRGKTTPLETPLGIRGGVGLPAGSSREIRERMIRALGHFASRIRRIAVRFEDVNGPRGGVDSTCRVEVVLDGLDTVLVEERARSPMQAFGRITSAVGRAVKRAISRNGGASALEPMGMDEEHTARAARVTEDDPGSFIGRRVGRSTRALERALERPEKRRRDAYIDTADVATSETDRRAGGVSTARRNARRRAPDAAHALEDSRQATPSRKSTRRSANRAKAAAQLTRRTRRDVQSPSARASRSTNT
jgi:hypothetical protein